MSTLLQWVIVKTVMNGYMQVFICAWVRRRGGLASGLRAMILVFFLLLIKGVIFALYVRN